MPQKALSPSRLFAPSKLFASSILLQILFFGAALVCAGHLSAAELRLQISDNRKPLGDVSVILESRDGKRLTTSTRADGQAAFTELAPGLYRLSLKATGFSTLEQPKLRLSEGKITTLEFSLKRLYRSKSTRDNAPIEEVLVLGTRVGVDSLAAVSQTELDREALRSAAGSGGDVMRALDGLPGLFSDGEFSGFTVRANGPRDNLILVDGAPYDKVVHFGDSFGELEDAEGGGRYSVFAPNIISEARFQPGGWEAAYGGRAGSLLSLNVAKGDPNDARYSTLIDITGAEFTYDGPSRLRKDTSLLLSARHFNFGRLFDAIGLDSIGEPIITDLILKTHSEPNPNSTFEFLAILAPESYDRRVENVLASDEKGVGSFDDTELVSSQSHNHLLSARWTLQLAAGELRQQLYNRAFDEEAQTGQAAPYAAPDYQPGKPGTGINPAGVPVRFPIIRSTEDESLWGWRLDWQQDNTWGAFTTGLELNHSQRDFSITLDRDWIRYVFEPSRQSNDQHFRLLTPAEINAEYKTSGMIGAFYLDQRFTLSRWDFRTGLRYEADDIIQDQGLSPRLAATRFLGDSLRMTLTAGRYQQSPLSTEIAADARNAELNYEIIDQWSLGFQYPLSTHWGLIVEPYYQQLDQLLVAPNDNNRLLTNSGEGESYGVDAGLSRQFNAGWSAQLNYSFSEARVRDSAQGADYAPDFHRPHALSLGGVYEFNDSWQLSGRWKWASGKPFGQFIIYEDVLAGTPYAAAKRYSKAIIGNNDQRYSPYSSLNVRLDYRRSIGPADLVAFVDVINLLSHNNPSGSRFDERTGQDVIEESSAIPLIGFRLAW
jgi:hypothetical protein